MHYFVILIMFLFLIALSFFFGVRIQGLFLLAVFVTGFGFAVYGFVAYIQRFSSRTKPGEAGGSGVLPEQDGDAKIGNREKRAGCAALSYGNLPDIKPDQIVNIFTERGIHMDRFFMRGLIIVIITLGLLVPLSFVSDMVNERSHTRRAALEDIEQIWGGVQRVSGPVLVIPVQRIYSYSEIVKDKDGNNVHVTKTGYSWEDRIFLPARVNFSAVLSPQIRYRGIYEHVVYSSPIRISGTFRLPTVESFGEDVSRIDWQRARFAIGVGDLKGITSETPLVWEGKTLGPYNPGTEVRNLIGPGFHTEVALSETDAGREESFSLSINLNGSGGLYFTPVGETTTIKVAGDWPHPSFSGDILPAKRVITDTNFEAEWLIPHLSRTYPQSGVFGQGSFDGDSTSITSFTAGINLFETVSLYTQTQRAVKYGILFIGLTFVALFAFELVTKVRMHLLQYGLVGISMTVFYLVLLSLAEHTSFSMAFAAASVITVLMNSLYIAAAQRSWIRGLIMAVLLSALYTLLHTLLRMEDYALLIGTAIVLIALGTLMFFTRNLPVHGKEEQPSSLREEESQA